MKPSDSLVLHRQRIKALVERHRLRNPRVFGSVARGEDTAGSDFDLLVDSAGNATLFDLAALEEEIEALTGLRIDVMTPGFLPEAWRPQVEREAIPL